MFVCLFLISVCWIIYTFQTFILYVDVHTLCCACRLNLVRVFQENTWHLQYLWAVENRAATWQGDAQRPMWARVSLKVPLSPVLLPLGITWDSADMLMLPGNNLCIEMHSFSSLSSFSQVTQCLSLTCSTSSGPADYSLTVCTNHVGNIWKNPIWDYSELNDMNSE